MQSAPETFVRGHGDCEDYARFAQVMLEKNGYKTYILGIETEDYGHAVCLVRESGGWGVVDLDKYEGGFTTIKELLGKRYPGWKRSYVLEQDSTSIKNMSQREINVR